MEEQITVGAIAPMPKKSTVIKHLAIAGLLIVAVFILFELIPQKTLAKWTNPKAYVGLCLSDAFSQVKSAPLFEASTLQLTLRQNDTQTLRVSAYFNNGNLTFGGDAQPSGDSPDLADFHPLTAYTVTDLYTTVYDNTLVEKTGKRSFYQKGDQSRLISATEYTAVIGRKALDAITSLIAQNNPAIAEALEYYGDTLDGDPVALLDLTDDGRIVYLELQLPTGGSALKIKLNFQTPASYLTDFSADIVLPDGKELLLTQAQSHGDGGMVHTLSFDYMSAFVKESKARVETKLKDGKISATLFFEVFGFGHTVKADGTYTDGSGELTLPLIARSRHSLTLDVSWVLGQSANEDQQTYASPFGALSSGKQTMLTDMLQTYLKY